MHCGPLIGSQRRHDVFRAGVEKWVLLISRREDKKKGRKKGRRGTRPGHGWITSSTRADKWTAEWERTPWDQIEYGLLLPGFIAVGYPKRGSHKLTQLKRGVGWGSLLLFVYRKCHRRTKQTASHCCQHGSFREYTQTDVKGRDISASAEHVVRGGGERPQIWEGTNQSLAVAYGCDWRPWIHEYNPAC